MLRPLGIALGFLLSLFHSSLIADGPADNLDAQVRRIPPLGLEIDPAIHRALLDQVADIEQRIPPRTAQAQSPTDWWDDVRVLTRGVRMTLEEQQIYKLVEIDHARELLKLADERSLELASRTTFDKEFRPSWARQAGRIILGYRSRLDDSIQPFGLLVPASAVDEPTRRFRLDVWLHGRDESVGEAAFLYRRWTQDSPYLPEESFVLQPWGRYSNAFRFAGEVDVLEVLDEVQRRYSIDGQRIAIRGFSMGGAGCWHFAVHHPDRFFAANPGAGFCETERFLTGFQSEVLNPIPSQRRLWNLYDCPPVVRNLTNLPTIAYSGGKDRQKEAADIMTEAALQAGFKIPYIIHPESAHAIHPTSKIEVERQMSEWAQKGKPTFPSSVSWTTYSLRYPGAYWIRMTRLGQHWEKANIEAAFEANGSRLQASTRNVERFEINLPAKSLPAGQSIAVTLDGKVVTASAVAADGSWQVEFQRTRQGEWNETSSRKSLEANSLEKSPGRQGPIDDAFLERFLIVKPSRPASAATIDAWVQRELEHAIEQWRRQFRGDARVKLDSEVTDADIRESNLVCFGTPSSNLIIGRAMSRLPFQWNDRSLTWKNQEYASSSTIPVMIFPNPLNSERYLVLNSGFTYREYDYLNNARQTPKLPDWAIVDAESPMTTRGPGRVLAEGFFNEKWELE